MSKKGFNSVKYQQEKRKENSRKFNKDPELFVKEIKAKYGKLVKKKEPVS